MPFNEQTFLSQLSLEKYFSFKKKKDKLTLNHPSLLFISVERISINPQVRWPPLNALDINQTMMPVIMMMTVVINFAPAVKDFCWEIHFLLPSPPRPLRLANFQHPG